MSTNRSVGRWVRAIAAVATSIVLLSGCEKDPDPPAELVDIKQKRKVSRVWSVGLGGDAERLRLALRPVLVEGVVYAASHDGDVTALSAANGKRLWATRTKLPLSAGPEVGAGLVVLGSSDGDLLVLDSKTGAERWRRAIGSEVLARPLVVNDLIIVRTVNGRLEAVSQTDGAPRWSVDESVPRLTLRGTSPPVLAEDRIIVGFDSGRVLAIDPRSGEVLWDTIVNAPRGRTELERLADIDAPVRVAGRDVFVVGFQGRIAMLALDSGQIWWARDASSYRGFAMDEQNIYLTNSDSIVSAMRRSDGAVLWEQSAMRKRALTAPAIDGDALVVADFEGFVHWLDKSTGEIIARQKADGDRITATPLSADVGVLIQTDAGKLVVFRSRPESSEQQSAAAAQ